MTLLTQRSVKGADTGDCSSPRLARRSVRVHRIPDLADPRTGRVNYLHLPVARKGQQLRMDVDGSAAARDSLLIEQLHLLDGGSEGRKDDHIAAIHDAVVLRSLLPVHELHIHRQQPLVDLTSYLRDDIQLITRGRSLLDCG